MTSERLPSSRQSLFFASVGLAFLAIALLLPAFRTTILKEPTDVLGWQALVTATALGTEALIDVSRVHARSDINAIALGLASAFSTLLLLVPLALPRIKQKRQLALLTGTAIFALTLSATAPFLLVNLPMDPLTGFYLWMAGGVLVLSAAASKCRQE